MHIKKYKAMENMQKHGGSFVQALGVAYMHADPRNSIRLENAFPDYFHEYENSPWMDDEK